MLTDNEIYHLCQRLDVPEPGKYCLLGIYKALWHPQFIGYLPAVQYPQETAIFKSLKMGWHFQFPVGHDYFEMIRTLEHDDDVLEYYPARSDMLKEIEDDVDELEWAFGMDFIATPHIKNHIRKVVAIECPTFFVIRRHGFGYSTWNKPQSPFRVRRCRRPGSSGQSPLRSRRHSRLGFRVWYHSFYSSSRHVAHFLETYLRTDRLPIQVDIVSEMLQCVVEHGFISLRQLCQSVGATIDDGYFLMALGLFPVLCPPGDVTNPDDVIYCSLVPDLYWEKRRYLHQYLFDSSN